MKRKSIIKSFEDFKQENRFDDFQKKMNFPISRRCEIEIDIFKITKVDSHLFDYRLAFIQNGKEVGINMIGDLESVYKKIYKALFLDNEKVKRIVESNGWYKMESTPELSNACTNGRRIIVAFNPLSLEVALIKRNQDLLFSALDYTSEMPEEFVLETFEKLINMGYSDATGAHVRLNGFYS